MGIRHFASGGLTRRIVLTGLLATGASAATPALAAYNSGRGDFRSLRLINSRTGEKVSSVYWVEGRYVLEALEAFNQILRDWRAEQATSMDPRVIDILAATHNLLDCREPFDIVSGYRTPGTNAFLRRRSRGVAKKSYHTRGMAVDIALKSRSVEQISGAGRALSAGGVGRYTRSKFVHLDSGPVRDWGR
ncbi:MAG: DUF882 domain-containing protein [Pseudomonadota bacterium]